jgi:hypothetical protein
MVSGGAGYREPGVPGVAGVPGAGAPPIPSLPGHRECRQPSLAVSWPLVVTCEDGDTTLAPGHTRLRCPFDRHLNYPDYGAFVACCPIDRPFACANSTPWQCFATANQAAASCGVDACVSCSEHDSAGAG